MSKKSKNKKIKVGYVILCLSLVIIVLLLVYFIIFKINDNKKLPQGPIIAEEKPETYTLSLAMVGDTLIHDEIYNEAHKNANYQGYDFKPMFSLIKKYIEDNNYDLAYYNQETIIGGKEIGLSTYPAFNSPEEIADAMIDAGFNLVSLATNHTLDRGEVAIENSCKYWNSKENVLSAGSYCSSKERNEVRIKEKNNIKYTLLSYTYGMNGISIPEGKEYLVNYFPMESGNPNIDIAYQNYKEQVKKDIEKVKDKTDLIIVAMHWGDEYSTQINEYQKDCAKFLADLGVNIVIGTHPHVIQPIEFIDDTLVIYSLGNFISSQDNDYDYAKLVGLLSSIDIVKTVENNKSSIELKNLDNELLFTYYDNETNFKVIPFSQINSSYLANYKEIYNKYANIVKEYDNNIKVVEVN